MALPPQGLVPGEAQGSALSPSPGWSAHYQSVQLGLPFLKAPGTRASPSPLRGGSQGANLNFPLLVPQPEWEGPRGPGQRRLEMGEPRPPQRRQHHQAHGERQLLPLLAWVRLKGLLRISAGEGPERAGPASLTWGFRVWCHLPSQRTHPQRPGPQLCHIATSMASTSRPAP